jgi:membrane-associated phospholipid phosphatase
VKATGILFSLSSLPFENYLTVKLFHCGTLDGVMIHPYSIDRPLAAIVAKLPDRVLPSMTFASFIAAAPAIAVIHVLVVTSAFIAGNDPLLKLGLLAVLFSPLAELAKLVTRRKRPETLYVQNMQFKTYSFPSGHSYISALVFGYLAVAAMQMLAYGWLIAIPLFLLIVLVGVSRIYLGAHFPSDVLAGWALGGIISYFIVRIGQ